VNFKNFENLTPLLLSTHKYREDCTTQAQKVSEIAEYTAAHKIFQNITADKLRKHKTPFYREYIRLSI
jgi:hypothetical protein